MAEGRRDLRGRERRGGHLVEEGLEEVVIPTVDERDPEGAAGELPGGGEAPKAAADDHHMRCHSRLL